MSKFRFHKVAAVVVLVAFAGWMGTGRFSSVGSAAPEAEEAAKKAEAEKPPVVLRTVAVITPPHTQYARAIRISGRTEAEKRVTLATRVMGVNQSRPVKRRGCVNP